MLKRKRTVTVGTTVTVDGVEQDVQVTFQCTPAERSGSCGPGCPAEAEMLGVACANGEKVPEAVTREIDFDALEVEALEQAEDAEYAEMERADSERCMRRAELKAERAAEARRKK